MNFFLIFFFSSKLSPATYPAHCGKKLSLYQVSYFRLKLFYFPKELFPDIFFLLKIISRYLSRTLREEAVALPGELLPLKIISYSQ